MGCLKRVVRRAALPISDQKGAGPLAYLAALLALAALVWGLGGNAISLGEAVNEKLSSKQIQAAFQQAAADADAVTKKLENENAPAYRIRFAQAAADEMKKHAARAESAEKSIMENFGEAKVKDILKNYAKGKALGLTPEETQWLIAEYENSNKIYDAATGKKSPYQKMCESVMAKLGDLMGSAQVRTRDELDRAMAEVETDYVVRTVAGDDPTMKAIVDCVRTGSDIDDTLSLYNCVKNNYLEGLEFEDLEERLGVFVNRLNRFWDQYPGEGTPESIRKLIEKMLREKYGLPESEEATLDLSRFTVGSWTLYSDATYKQVWKNGVIQSKESRLNATNQAPMTGEFKKYTFTGSGGKTESDGCKRTESISATFTEKDGKLDTATKVHIEHRRECPGGGVYYLEIDATNLEVRIFSDNKIYCIATKDRGTVSITKYSDKDDMSTTTLEGWTYGEGDSFSFTIEPA